MNPRAPRARTLALLLAALGAALAPAPAPAAAAVYLAFGDSLTFGIGDTRNPPGYPARLERILEREGMDAEVRNFGIPSETTSMGLARIGAVLAEGGDELLLMEGTNDVPRLSDGTLSIETVLDNLNRMAAMAAGAGIAPTHVTIIPRLRSRPDRRNIISERLTWEIRELAVSTNRGLVDAWEAFDPNLYHDAFDTLYTNDPDDPVGHPNEAGYDRMAEAFADVLLGLDTVPPVPGVLVPGGLPDEIEPGTEIRARVLEPKAASGIKLNATALLINGREVATPIGSSNRRRAEMAFDGDPGCRAEVGVRTEDRADPPNVTVRRLKIYDVVGRSVLAGDADSDCRVDGADLVRLGPAFGSVEGDDRFDPLLDFTGDGEIDGRDLARLAGNFGSSSL